MALEEFTSGGHRDFRQRYLEVYGFFPVEDREILVNVTNVGENNMSFVDARGISYTAYADKGVVFRFIPVNKRLFYHDGQLCYASRRPARQYQRGITHANTEFRTVYGHGLEVDFATVKSYVNSRDKKNAGKCLILSDFLGITDNMLFLYNQNIGVVYGNKLELNTPLFKQEVMDAVKANGLSYEVNA